MHRSRLIRCLQLALGFLLLPLANIVGPPATAAAQAPMPTSAEKRPNVVFILTEDLDLGVYQQMPRLKSLLVDQGLSFTNDFVSLSLCCPSRTAILRSEYAHNSRIFTNSPPGGGFEKVFSLGLESSTVATWLHDAGYRTALMGKYLNGYPHSAGVSYVPPGWDEWYSPSSGNPYSEFNYTLNENGTQVRYGSDPAAYLVDVLAGKAQDFIQRSVANNPAQPFFLYVATYAPHQPATPAPRYADAFPGVQAPRTPSFNEADVSDKPAWVQTHPLLNEKQIAGIDHLYQKRLQSMLAVEDLVADVIDTLQANGQLENTYIVFTSDNGFHQGQHRLESGKNTEFEEDLRVPLVVRGPGVPAGVSREEMTLNIDFAPTFAELGQATVPDFVDGRSLVPLLHQPFVRPAGGPRARREPASPVPWRQAILIEHAFPGDPTPEPPPGSALEPPDPFDLAIAAKGGPEMPPVFQGIQTARQIKYVLYQDDETEVYDLAHDPYELTNLASTAGPDVTAELNAWLNTLKDCSGAACRAAEEAPPH